MFRFSVVNCNYWIMGAHGSKEKLSRTASERYVHSKIIEQERFGRFGKRGRGKFFDRYSLDIFLLSFFLLYVMYLRKRFTQKLYAVRNWSREIGLNQHNGSFAYQHIIQTMQIRNEQRKENEIKER